MKVLFLFLILVSLVMPGCSFGNDGDPVSQNESGIMPDGFWGKGDNSDLPWAFESVCVDKLPGTDLEKCGDTHFDLDGYMIVIDYTLYESPELAKNAFDKAARTAKKILRRGSVTTGTGEKILITREDRDKKLSYVLIWIRGNRIAEVISESLSAVEKYEADRKL